MDYTTLPFAQVQAGLDAVAAETLSTFGAVDARQLNWRPDRTRWSVAQCFEHLFTANRLMADAAERIVQYRLVVHPSLRREGIGRQLVKRVEQFLAEQGAERVTVLIEADRPWAVEFWNAVGYPPDLRIVRHVGTMSA